MHDSRKSGFVLNSIKLINHKFSVSWFRDTFWDLDSLKLQIISFLNFGIFKKNHLDHLFNYIASQQIYKIYCVNF